MGVFRFRKFSVRNEKSAMKVNTDGVLLGASMTLLPSDRRLLDIGTGTGTVALMAAQRLSAISSGCIPLSEGSVPFRIAGIDIDRLSADEAGENFRMSPWDTGLVACGMSLESLAELMRTSCDGPVSGPFDAIFSNPPYFESSLKAPDERRRAARHADTLSYREIMDFSAEFLSDSGHLALILPADLETDAVRHAAGCGLHKFRVLRVRTVARKLPSRVILEFSRRRMPVSEEMLTLQEAGEYTGEYKTLTHDFLLWGSVPEKIKE